MDLFNYIVDVLSAIVSILAIITVSAAWYKSSQKFLKVDRVIIRYYQEKITCILLIKNLEPQVVKIKTIECYTRKTYIVEKINNSAPQCIPTLNPINSLFTSSELKEIVANRSSTNVEYRVSNHSKGKKIKKLLFFMNTSHGFLSLKCKKIDTYEMWSPEASKVNFCKRDLTRLQAWKEWVPLKLQWYYSNLKSKK